MHGGEYFASAVGEVNVVAKMKEVGAVIGGEATAESSTPNCTTAATHWSAPRFS